MRNPWFILLAVSISNFSFAQSPADREYLNVSISVFDMNLSDGDNSLNNKIIHPEIRRAEVRYIPAYLQLELIESDNWGAVRILPSADTGAELSISGKIIDSDGARLVLQVLAEDSTGRIWFHRNYSGEAVESVSATQSLLGTEPFNLLYREISRELAEVYNTLSVSEINLIKSLSRLRYAASLAPDIYSSYFRKNDDGLYVIDHLPAGNDPNFQRIREIREHEFLFIDVVNEEYYSFFVNIKPVYDLWRTYRREQLENESFIRELKANSRDNFSPGGYQALREGYNNYRLAKLEDQYLEEISERFHNEILSNDITLKDSIFRLTGALEEQYTQWRNILKELYELEN